MKTKKTIIFAALLSAPLFLLGCAHNAIEQRVDDKVAMKTEVNTTSEQRAEANEKIESAPGLTPEQRTQLSMLRDTTRNQMDEMRKESLRLRSVLVEDVMAQNYKPREVAVIKKKIKSVEEKRITTLFDAVEQANRILGRKAPEHTHLVQAFMSRSSDQD